MNFNQTILVGRLTADPEFVKLGNINKLTFVLAVNYKKKEGAEGVDFIPIVAFSNLAEIGNKILSKGALVLVKGKLKISKYKDKNGINRSSTDIVADTVNLIRGEEDIKK